MNLIVRDVPSTMKVRKIFEGAEGLDERTGVRQGFYNLTRAKRELFRAHYG